MKTKMLTYTIRILLDSGASVSIVPRYVVNERHKIIK